MTYLGMSVLADKMGKMVDDIGETDTESHDSEHWHPADDFEDIDANLG